MEAQLESTKHFANQTGDKITIELVISGNPDNVISQIMKSIHTDCELFDGAKVNMLYFKGYDNEKIINSIKVKALTNIMNEINDTIEELQK